MRTRPDFDRLASTWLADGPSELADRVLDAALREIHLTQQRSRSSTPWRTLWMSLPLRAAAAIAILAVIGVAGLSLVGRPGFGTPPTSMPTQLAPSALPTFDWPIALAAGTYSTTFIWDTPVSVTFTVPEGWSSRDVEIFTDPVSRVGEVGGPRGRSLMFALVDNVYGDPCAGTFLQSPLPGSVDALSNALATLPGVTSTAPVPITLGGYSGEYVEFALEGELGCELADFHLWTTRSEWMKPDPHSGGTTFTAERERYRAWVLDVEGIRYLVAAISAADATPADLAELQAVIDSLEIEVVGPS